MLAFLLCKYLVWFIACQILLSLQMYLYILKVDFWLLVLCCDVNT